MLCSPRAHLIAQTVQFCPLMFRDAHDKILSQPAIACSTEGEGASPKADVVNL